MNDYKERLLNEEVFHDAFAEKVDVNQLDIALFFNAETALENSFIWNKIKNLPGKMLDLGCGYGEAAVFFAKHGFEVVAIDISQKMLDVALLLAKKEEVNITVIKSSAHKLPFDDNQFDFVYANGVLHHAPIIETVKEINRVLKSSGKAFCIEPLGYNPIISVYRVLAKSVRTLDEKPITLQDIRNIKKEFPLFKTHYFWFFSLSIFLYMFLVLRLNPSKVRYWKYIIYQHDKFSKMIRILAKMDRVVLTNKFTKILGVFSWNIVLELGK